MYTEFNFTLKVLWSC